VNELFQKVCNGVVRAALEERRITVALIQGDMDRQSTAANDNDSAGLAMAPAPTRFAVESLVP
jgi:hypothetical protein